MKSKNKFMVATLLLLVGMGAITVSCKKEEKSQSRRAGLVVEQANEKGGDDDEDPIILGTVKKRGLQVIDSAFVEVINYSTNVRINSVYTDSSGQFRQPVSKGVYFFRVTEPYSTTTFVTDTIRVETNQNITIVVD